MIRFRVGISKASGDIGRNGNITMKKPEARGPTPSEKARKALGQKLNRPSKPPPSPNDLLLEKKAAPTKPIKGD